MKMQFVSIILLRGFLLFSLYSCQEEKQNSQLELEKKQDLRRNVQFSNFKKFEQENRSVHFRDTLESVTIDLHSSENDLDELFIFCETHHVKSLTLNCHEILLLTDKIMLPELRHLFIEGDSISVANNVLVPLKSLQFLELKSNKRINNYLRVPPSVEKLSLYSQSEELPGFVLGLSNLKHLAIAIPKFENVQLDFSKLDSILLIDITNTTVGKIARGSDKEAADSVYSILEKLENRYFNGKKVFISVVH